MNLEEIQKQAENDLKIDDLELASESTRNAALHQKYLTYLNHFKGLLITKRKDLKRLKLQKWEYFTGKSDPQVYRDNPFDHKILKADLHIYLDADEDLAKQQALVEYYEMCVDTCERYLKNISDRQWNIKNAIAWRKFETGEI
jgi:hypothetical protein